MSEQIHLTLNGRVLKFKSSDMLLPGFTFTAISPTLQKYCWLRCAVFVAKKSVANFFTFRRLHAVIGFRTSFICQGTSTRRQRSDLFRSLSQAATCYYQSKPLIGRGNLVKCLVQGQNKRTSRPISTLTLLNAERQARKL